MPQPQHLSLDKLVAAVHTRPQESLLVIAGCVLTFLIIHFGIPFKNKLGNNGTYRWFLINAVFIHIMLDGLVGYFHLIPPLEYLYYILDMRYREEDSVVMLVCILELIVMAPGCFLIALSYKNKQHSLFREYLIVIISVIQLIGTVFFCYHEWKGRDMIDACPWGCLTFTPENLFFFWGVFLFANSIWIVVPLIIIRDSYNRTKGLLGIKDD